MLSTDALIQFATDGVVFRYGVVPERLNRRVLERIVSGSIEPYRAYPPAQSDCHQSEARELPFEFLEILALQPVREALDSLLGCGSAIDHHVVHLVPAHSHRRYPWHTDSAYWTGPGFDVQVFYFPHAVTHDMGGTMFLPGSHLRAVGPGDLERYDQFINQDQVCCPAGSLVLTHEAIWHRARQNRTSARRVLVKLQIAAINNQAGLWQHSELERRSLRYLERDHRWYGSDWSLEVEARRRFVSFMQGEPLPGC